MATSQMSGVIQQLRRVLGSEEGDDKFLSERMIRKRLSERTPCIWRVVDGNILYHKTLSFTVRPKITNGEPALPAAVPPPYSWSGNAGPDAQHPRGSSGTLQPNSVPEPSAWNLMADTRFRPVSLGTPSDLQLHARRKARTLVSGRARNLGPGD
jgi:hypothetical protein